MTDPPWRREITRRWARIVIASAAVLGSVVAATVLRSGSPTSERTSGPAAQPTSEPAADSAGDATSLYRSPPSSSPPRPRSSPMTPTGPAKVAGSSPPTLVTNEYAYHHQGAADAVRSPDWIVTSGSLYAAGDLLWSGHPDDRSPGPRSAQGNDSAVLRAVSTRTDHGNVRVSFALRTERLIQTARTPSKDTDGLHVFLHYQSQFSTYYVSVFRRDGQVTIKRKVPGGPSNGGTYDTLASAPSSLGPDLPGAWHRVEATISDAGHGVRLALLLDGHPALDVVDHGGTSPAIAAPGRVGLRGDNCEFYVRDFRTEPLT